MHKLRYRQVHLDFHTSPAIDNIGGRFDKKQFQQALKAGHVNSITCFSKCHHGWSYHPTKVGKTHPNLKINLFAAQYEACKEINVNVPIYLSAGVDNVMSYERPDWRVREAHNACQSLGGNTDPFRPSFHLMCFHSPYLEYLAEQVREAVRMFPKSDGVFLDIIHQGQCCCKHCVDWMHANDLDPQVEADRKVSMVDALDRYYRVITEACKCDDPNMPVFHNSGHIQRGQRDILQYFSHLELESLPTGGWGYDHFPMSAKYCENLPHDFLGMTGKFHTTWGEFGGYKHPNALRYECAAMLAYNSKCSVGDQLHPEGAMDMSTYEIIGQAYAEVEAKEPWSEGATSIAEIGLFSSDSLANPVQQHHAQEAADVGASRILLEGHFLFTVLDREMDFSKYRMIILPDNVVVDDALQTKLNAYVAAGGKLFITGKSVLKADGSGLAFDIGATWHGTSEFKPDYALPTADLRASFLNMPMVMYTPSQRIKATKGQSLGQIFDPYFNRSYRRFCSHQHTPNNCTPSPYDCGVLNGNILYLAHEAFTLYRAAGAVAYKEWLIRSIKKLLGEPVVRTNMPSTARVSLNHQPDKKRYVLHLLYANTVNRGGQVHDFGMDHVGNKSVEVIDELMPLHDVKVDVVLPKKITRATIVPDNRTLTVTTQSDRTHLAIDEFTCHCMIELSYA